MTTSAGPKIIPSRHRKYHPLPQSTSAARKFLKQHIHVNIKDYMAARRRGDSDYGELLFHSRKALIAYTRENERYVKKDFAKKLWLQPLMEFVLSANI